MAAGLRRSFRCPSDEGYRSRSRRAAALLTRCTIAALATALLAAGCALHGWRGPVTDHFDGWRFHQPEPLSIGFGDWLKRALGGSHRGAWRDFTDAPPGPPPPARVGDGRLRATFVGHSTVLLQMDDLNILTDPTWSNRSGPIVIGQRRRRPPGLRFEDLPRIDAVLISHDHYDHMDLPTLRQLTAREAPRIYVGLGNADYLSREGVPGAIELDWWQSAPLSPAVTVTAVLARHMSGRGLLDQDRSLWCGFVVKGPSGAVYFAGDTGLGTHFAEIGKRFPHLRFAILPIGGFKPEWYMREQHLGPATAVAAHRTLGAMTSMPVHFGTFPNGDDAETEPIDTLRAILAAAPAPAPRFVILDNGQSAEIPAVEQ